ncbi:MAG: hypothetical protein CM15mP74_27860 [Halieaceae bacterium]|nr:MAG: hypothetical protein CM15mP74_27860 [Halieaceae bacterium]
MARASASSLLRRAGQRWRDFFGAESSPQGAYLYFLKAMEWAAEENIEMFYFSSFDEPEGPQVRQVRATSVRIGAYGTRVNGSSTLQYHESPPLAYKRAICYPVSRRPKP